MQTSSPGFLPQSECNEVVNIPDQRGPHSRSIERLSLGCGLRSPSKPTPESVASHSNSEANSMRAAEGGMNDPVPMA